MKQFRFALLLSCVIAFTAPALTMAETPTAVLSGGGVISQVATPVPVPTPTVPVAVPAAPPEWAQDILVSAEALPVVGPIVAKLLLYVGVFSSILTGLVACLLTIVNTLMGVLNLAGLVNAAQALAAFRDGKFMYWLKFFSLFNAAKKPTTP